MPDWTDIIDPVLARYMHDVELLTWKEVGIELARRKGRRSAYKAESVKQAVRVYEQGINKNWLNAPDDWDDPHILRNDLCDA